MATSAHIQSLWTGWLRCLVLGLSATALGACASELPQIALRPPALMDFILVRSPPPVVPVDIQPPSPSADAVWVPGSWSWRAARWSWQPGAWFVPPAGASRSPWVWAYQADGQVRFWEARWFGPDGQVMDEPLPVRAGRSSARR